jgi:hypothetical protein
MARPIPLHDHEMLSDFAGALVTPPGWIETFGTARVPPGFSLPAPVASSPWVPLTTEPGETRLEAPAPRASWRA